VNGFADRLQHEAGETECHWHDLLICRPVERAVPAKESRADRLDRERLAELDGSADGEK